MQHPLLTAQGNSPADPASVTVARIDMLADLLGVASWRSDEEPAPLQAFPMLAPSAG